MYFPAVLKTAQTASIDKSGQRTDPGNYRLISQLPKPPNILEKIVKDRLYLFLEGTNLLTLAQCGYRSKMSTSSAVFDLVSDIQTSLDGNSCSAALSIDIGVMVGV